jgi:hypothetical protein
MPNPDLRGSQSQPLGRPFVIRRHHIPRRLLCRSLLNHFFVGFHVIIPEVALGGVIGGELPILLPVVDSLQKPVLLFLF